MRSLPTRYVVIRPANPDIVVAFSCEPESIADIERTAVAAVRSAGHDVDWLDTSIRSVWTDRDGMCLLAVPSHVESYDETSEYAIRRAGSRT